VIPTTVQDRFAVPALSIPCAPVQRARGYATQTAQPYATDLPNDAMPWRTPSLPFQERSSTGVPRCLYPFDDWFRKGIGLYHFTFTFLLSCCCSCCCCCCWWWWLLLLLLLLLLFSYRNRMNPLSQCYMFGLRGKHPRKRPKYIIIVVIVIGKRRCRCRCRCCGCGCGYCCIILCSSSLGRVKETRRWSSNGRGLLHQRDKRRNNTTTITTTTTTITTITNQEERDNGQDFKTNRMTTILHDVGVGVGVGVPNRDLSWGASVKVIPFFVVPLRV